MRLEFRNGPHVATRGDETVIRATRKLRDGTTERADVDAWKARNLVTAVSAPQSQPVPSSLEPLPIPARRRFGR